LAHNFRWTHAVKAVDGGVSVLDVGCGVDMPFFRTFDRAHTFPKHYVGVDLNRLPSPPHRKWAAFYEEFDFTRRFTELGAETFDLIVCFEVIEHMPVSAGKRLVQGIRYCLAPNGCALVSTPVIRRDGHQAKNHIHEYTIPELANEFNRAGLEPVALHGTFASWPDIKKVLTAAELELAMKLTRCCKLRPGRSTDQAASIVPGKLTYALALFNGGRPRLSTAAYLSPRVYQ
jgi:SAM-dependent methyltransferase